MRKNKNKVIIRPLSKPRINPTYMREAYIVFFIIMCALFFVAIILVHFLNQST